MKPGVGTSLCAKKSCDSADISTCAEASCETFDESSCPTTRTGNKCEVYDGDCLPSCSTFSSAQTCPGSEHGGCIFSGGCKNRGSCGASPSCPSGKVVISVPAPFCAGVTCATDDCCAVPAECPMSIYDTVCTGAKVLKMEEFTCAKDVCTEAECCRAATTTTTTTTTTTPLNTNGMMVFPYDDVGSGHSHTFLKDKGGTISVTNSTTCDGNILDCYFMYEMNDLYLYVKDHTLCGGTQEFDCCITHDLTTVNKATGCSGTKCQWCIVGIGDDESSSYTLRPQTGATCVDYMTSCGSMCPALAANQDNEVTVSEHIPLEGKATYEVVKKWDARIRFSGINDFF